MASITPQSIDYKGPQVPEDPAKAIAHNSKAWENFVTNGRFTEAKPREVIADSWERSRDNGLDPQALRAPTTLSFQYLKEYMQKHELGLAGGNVLNSFSDLMAGSAHVIALADAKGQMLYSVGQQQLQNKLERINFLPGSSWNEKEVGPNGIGTPLMIGRPEIVLGTEHYCEGWQPLVCYGAPVRAPGSNKIIGAVDITGEARFAKNENMVLTMSIAQTIEQVMQVKHLQLREEQRELLEQFDRRWPNEGLMLFHSDGDFLDLNTRAARMLGLNISTTKHDLSERFPEFWRNLQPTINRGENKNNFVFTGADHVSLECKIEPFEVSGQFLGWILILAEKKALQHKTESRQKRDKSKRNYSFEDIKGNSDCMQRAMHLARSAARDPLENAVLIQGETGTGKEMVAQAIHSFSNRVDGPFIAINCGALPADLVESELFGYEGGAFTGAKRQGMSGKFEAANGGTLFLDEINSMPIQVQVKLLRVLEGNTVMRLGSHETSHVDFRLIAASGSSLRQQCDEGGFRLDLFHRLSVLEIELPALCDRGDDIKLLAEYFLEEGCRAAGRSTLEIADEVQRVLQAYHWPGNLRELYNICHRWILTVTGQTVTMLDLPNHLPGHLKGYLSVPKLVQASSLASSLARSLDNNGEDLKSVNADLMRQTLTEENGNVTKAAKKLGIARSTLYRHLKK